MANKLTRMLFGLLACGALSASNVNAQAPAAADPASSSKPAAGSATQPTYQAGDVYLPTSKVYVFVGKRGFGHEHGVVGSLKSGRVLLDREKDAGELVFDMRSFQADTAAARKAVGLKGATAAKTQQEVTSTMLGKSVLNARKYPTAKFMIESSLKQPEVASGKESYLLKGQLTIHKTTRPVQVTAEASMEKGWLRVRGKFDMKQTNFGIRPYSKAFGAVGVTDLLTVSGDFWVAASAGRAAEPK